MPKTDRQILLKLRQKQLEVSFLPPQEIGPLTPLYKDFIGFLKVRPWRLVLALSFLLVLGLKIISGDFIIKLVNLLQAGF